MVGKRIQGRSVAGRLAYISAAKRPEDISERPEGDPLQGMGGKVLAAGAVNAESWQDAAREIQALDNAYQGKTATTEHIMLSWREQGEARPTTEELAIAAKEICEKIGLGNSPCCFCAHQDTGHIHLHLVVSRVETDDNGRLRIIDGTAWVVDKKKHNHNNVVESVHVALAVLCRDHGWAVEEHARYGPDLQRIHYLRESDGLRLPQKILNAETHSGQQHPARVLGEKARDILRQAKNWPEAHAALSAAGIRLDRVPLRNGGEGGVLRSTGKTKIKLSCLPADLSLNNLDRLYNGAPTTPQPPASPAGAVRILREAAQRRPAVLTPSRVKGLVRRGLENSANWSDFLSSLQKDNFRLLRAGRNGAAILAPIAPTTSKNASNSSAISAPENAAQNAQEIRIKLSEIGCRNSYLKVSERFGTSLENAYQNGDISEELFRSTIQYLNQHQNQAENPAQNATDPNAVRLPAHVRDNEILTGRPDALQTLAETARDVIQVSIREDRTISQTVTPQTKTQAQAQKPKATKPMRAMSAEEKAFKTAFASLLPKKPKKERSRITEQNKNDLKAMQIHHAAEMHERSEHENEHNEQSHGGNLHVAE